MKSYFSKVLLPVAGFSLIWMAGCQCPANRQAGFPRIQCQPVDTTVTEDQKAEFKVKAAGACLTYQWLHNDEPLLHETNALLVVSGVNEQRDDKLGFYHCRIESGVVIGDPKTTETRKAALGLSTVKLGSMNGTNALIMSEQQPFPPGSGSTYNGPECIGKYCTYRAFSATHQATKTTLAATLEKKVNGTYVLQPVSQYELLWKYTKPTTSGCATNYTDFEKRAQSVLSKKYKFTVYIKPGYCETKTTNYKLSVYFLP